MLGARWTLLIVRELLVRPSRFSDLADSLGGIGPNLLAERLREMTSQGLIDSRPVQDDGRSREYFLTNLGIALRPIVLELGKWGLEFIRVEDYVAEGEPRPEWVSLGIEALIRGKTLDEEITETYELDVSGSCFYVEVDRGRPEVTFTRPDVDTSVTIRASGRTFMDMGVGRLNPVTALVSGAVQVEGDEGSFERCGRLLGLM